MYFSLPLVLPLKLRFLAFAAIQLCLSILASASLHAEIGANNVLVLYNADQGTSGPGFQIADYYRNVRPGVHLLGLTDIDQILSGTSLESVSADDYLNIIRPQVLAGIDNIADSVDVIVTTKGLPLKIDAGKKDADSTALLWRRYSSLESELTRIDSIETKPAMGDQFIFTGFPDLDPTHASNPYYNRNQRFTRAGSDPLNGDIRLAARLDGYSVDSVKRLIDRSQNVYVVPKSQLIIADDDPTASVDQMVDSELGGPGPGLVYAVESAGYQIVYENTDAAITSSRQPIQGYVSHGLDDGSGGLEVGYIQSQLDFTIGKGAVFITHESWNARTFDPLIQQSQGLIAEWIEIGGSAGLGHVHEPYNGPDNVANEDIFFSGLLPAAGATSGESGLTFVEAAWNAIRQLSYVNTVVGDPLMRWQVWLPGDANLDGKVGYQDFYALQGNWLQAGNYPDGDFNVDGTIDMLDFDILLQNWFVAANSTTLSANDFEVLPTIDSQTGKPSLSARLLSSANLDGDLDVDSEDLAILRSFYDTGAGGDIDGDGDTDGRDFLIWQRQVYEYNLTADFEIDGSVGPADLTIWQTSFGKNQGGDADGDHDTDGHDFLAWQRQFTANASPSVYFSVAVPEPCSLCYMLGMLQLLLGIRIERTS